MSVCILTSRHGPSVVTSPRPSVGGGRGGVQRRRGRGCEAAVGDGGDTVVVEWCCAVVGVMV